MLNLVVLRRTDMLLLLELAAAVAANALRAHHLAIEGDCWLGEPAEVTTARILACACDELVETLNDYRCRILARLAHERSTWPF